MRFLISSDVRTDESAAAAATWESLETAELHRSPSWLGGVGGGRRARLYWRKPDLRGEREPDCACERGVRGCSGGTGGVGVAT